MNAPDSSYVFMIILSISILCHRLYFLSLLSNPSRTPTLTLSMASSIVWSSRISWQPKAHAFFSSRTFSKFRSVSPVLVHSRLLRDRVIDGINLSTRSLLNISSLSSSFKPPCPPVYSVLIFPHLLDQPTPLTNRLSPFIKHKRYGNEYYFEQAKHSSCPLRPQTRIHARAR